MTTKAQIALSPLPDAQLNFLLSSEALDFLVSLHKRFSSRQEGLLKARQKRQRKLDKGLFPQFNQEVLWANDPHWQVAPCKSDLQKRNVEITGPVDAKMIINALNSGADVFMADFEDSSAPSWENMLWGQLNLYQAVRKILAFDGGKGKVYTLNDELATLVVRPRGLHLLEKHLLIDGMPIAGSLFDFGLYFFHNAAELIARGSGAYFYLPKMENHLEARFWNDVFNFAQDYLGIARGNIRATMLIETIMASHEMEEILYELREHAAGLNAGRWDYIFSFIKRLRNHKQKVLPDRALITMEVPFMRAYCQRLVDVCHRRRAHAMGGMSAFIPDRNDPEVTAKALVKVKSDKAREAGLGFDGTWVAHPDLIEVARAEFDLVLAGKPHQKEKLVQACGCDGVGEEVISVTEASLVSLEDIPDSITEKGIRLNINVALQYIAAWLGGRGAVAIHNLMEDAATAEISRAQLWQWLKHGSRLHDGRKFTRNLYKSMLHEEMQSLLEGASCEYQTRLKQAEQVLNTVVLQRRFEEFLTLVAYEVLLQNEQEQLQAVSPQKSNDQNDQPGILVNKENQTAQESPAPVVEVSQIAHKHTHDHSHGNDNAPENADGCCCSIFTPAQELQQTWDHDPRWHGVSRAYSAEDVLRLRPSINGDFALAKHGAAKLWGLLHSEPQIIALGAMNGSQAVQMVKGGLKAIYLSGWQVAADANLAGHTYPDQSLYPSNSAPIVVKRLNNAMTRLDQIMKLEGKGGSDNYLPIVADAEAGFGGPLQAFELMKLMIESGAAGVHFEDQLAAEKKCGHMGGKVLVPTAQFVRTLAAARMAADIADVPTLLVARTDALDATLLTSDIDPADRPFLTGERTAEGFFRVKGGIESCIARGLAYAPYADLIWFESSRPDLAQAKRFADAIHAKFPGKLLAYNCSPSFNWKQHLDDATIAKFNSELGKMGYKFQFITLAGWHSVNLGAFKLASEYAREGMPAYVRLQEEEFALADKGYTAVRHQAEVGAGWFDNLLLSITAGASSTAALSGSTEEEQFHGEKK
jgi:malate synthase A